MVTQTRAAGPRVGSHVRHRARARCAVTAGGLIHSSGYPEAPAEPGELRGQTHVAPGRSEDGTRARQWHDSTVKYVYDRRFDRPDAGATFLVPTPVAARGAGIGPSPPGGASPYLSSLYGQAALLRPEDEARLFLKMNYLKHLASKLRTAQHNEAATEASLEEIERVETEARAVRDAIVRANLRLVVSLARTRAGLGRSFDELVSDGNLSLFRAVARFDASRGYKFSTYASHVILKNLAREDAAERRRNSRFVTGDEALLDGAAESRAETSAPEGERRRIQESVRLMLDRLSAREREVLVARFGVDGGPEKTFQQLGEKLGVTRERVRQIQTRALEKLRENAGTLGLDPPA